ncbi:6-phosphogluconate dehydrogenase [Daldinia decipiens]|uniref:6-phosphogluconate dehydrogenase n=1 Tax=Daldinia decipiens TaxID=326647 RepID=UPI0020C3D61F|nr:6-phosphogluconate dehydrogenase [Daldinia decipiens]KAI1654078.1 6-phosphogluconate dehydrogenase [Daldinia decipiens]
MQNPSCVGPRGSGHYVKMVHNGIENGMLSTVCEAWNSEGELKNTYLIQIGSEICQRKKTPKGDQKGEGKGESGYVLDDVLDKVVQDDDGSEGKCIQIWRAGCIIQEDYIADMLEPILLNAKEPIMNMKLIDEVATDLQKNFDALKQITLKAIEWDNYVPSISASLEYVKYVSSRMLATQFMEAEMDFFSAHAYDRPNVIGEDPGKPSKGAHHYEWRPA